MIRGRRSKAPSWSGEEIAILIDVYAREGVNGAAEALPDRSWRAIQQVAHKLGVRSPTGTLPAPRPKLDGDQLEEAIRLREQEGWTFDRIGLRFCVSGTAAQNAILIALCPRKGFVPAEREENGRLLPEGLDRLRAMLRDGVKAVDIALRLGLSSARIAEERRRYNRERKANGERPLPPPGDGLRYSGAKISNDVYDQVDRLLMQGYGSPRVAAWVGVSKTHVKRRRMMLVRQLARDGECLPGCDISGKRYAQKDTLSAVAPFQKELLRTELMKGTPVKRAAKIAVIGETSAFRLRDELKAELEEKGQALPPIERLGRVKAAPVDRKLAWLPKGKANLLIYRKHLKETGNDPVEAKRRTIDEISPPVIQAPLAPKRPLTFEEKLAMVERGEIGIVKVVPLRRPGYAGTLGGVASALL